MFLVTNAHRLKAQYNAAIPFEKELQWNIYA